MSQRAAISNRPRDEPMESRCCGIERTTTPSSSLAHDKIRWCLADGCQAADRTMSHAADDTTPFPFASPVHVAMYVHTTPNKTQVLQRLREDAARVISAPPGGSRG